MQLRYSGAMMDSVFYKKNMKNTSNDEKNMTNMKNFDEYKYVSISLGNITKYQYDITSWFMKT